MASRFIRFSCLVQTLPYLVHFSFSIVQTNSPFAVPRASYRICTCFLLLLLNVIYDISVVTFFTYSFSAENL